MTKSRGTGLHSLLYGACWGEGVLTLFCKLAAWRDVTHNGLLCEAPY